MDHPSGSEIVNRRVISISREVVNQDDFDAVNDHQRRHRSLAQQFRKICPLQCSGACWVKFLRSVFPFVGILAKYQKKDVVGDVISGVTVGVMHIPQGKWFHKMIPSNTVNS